MSKKIEWQDIAPLLRGLVSVSGDMLLHIDEQMVHTHIGHPLGHEEWVPAPTAVSGAHLAQVLFWVANWKHGRMSESWFRGFAVPQAVQVEDGPWCLNLYEAGYRNTIYPRYTWVLDDFGVEDWLPDALWGTLRREMASESFLGSVDLRRPATVRREVTL